jgi:hypothetical protein
MLRPLTLGLVLSCAVACGKEASPTVPSPGRSPSPYSLRASGTVVEIQGGPVAEASVVLARCGPPPTASAILSRASTGESGGFTLQFDAQPPPDCVLLRVEKHGFVPVSLYDSRSMSGIRVRLQRLRRVTGRVVAVDGDPLSSVKVTPYGPFNGTESVTDNSGAFVLNDVGNHLVSSRAATCRGAVQFSKVTTPTSASSTCSPSS